MNAKEQPSIATDCGRVGTCNVAKRSDRHLSGNEIALGSVLHRMTRHFQLQSHIDHTLGRSNSFLLRESCSAHLHTLESRKRETRKV